MKGNDLMRIFLKQAKNVGTVSYPCAGFYNNVDDALAKEWIDAGIAQEATEHNELVEPPAPPVAPSAPAVEPEAAHVESVPEHETT